jgi:sulfite reductase (NADPH) hemoprotein beta-component
MSKKLWSELNPGPGPLIVDAPLADAERLKKESHFLRGTIADDLKDGLTGGFNGDNFLLIRFHGMYQQDDPIFVLNVLSKSWSRVTP